MVAFRFKQFSISQEHAALKLGTDAMLLGCLTSFQNPAAILDIGTGTGILSLMMAQRYPCPITAIDIDENAIIDANKNIQASPWSDRIVVQQVSFQDFVDLTTQQFDGIICNPPFFFNSLQSTNQSKAVARHTISLTPEILFSGIEKLLSSQGMASVIVPFQGKNTFIAAAAQQSLSLTKDISVFPFTQNCTANRSILTFSRQWQSLQTDKICIREEKNVYSLEYKELTKAFYF